MLLFHYFLWFRLLLKSRRECWGKMWAYENKWDLAKIEFMDAFSSAVSVEKRAYELY